MGLIIVFFILAATATVHSKPYLYNPYYKQVGYSSPYFNNVGNYGNQPPYTPFFSTYNPYEKDLLASYFASRIAPILNIFPQKPLKVSNKFTVVPLSLISKENTNVVNKGQIVSVSRDKPVMMVKSGNNVIPCTPAVKVVLEEPILVYSLKSNIVFPAEILVKYENYGVPIKVGSIIATVSQNTYVSTETPIYIKVIYAIPTQAVRIDYVNNFKDIFTSPETDAVVVESEPVLPPKNVTIIDFPDTEGEPQIQVDEEDEELVNRNPPIVLAPAGIVQSTQPHTIVEPFHNSKESAVLIALREEALNRRV